MSKIFKDEKIFNNFKKQYKQIFRDQSFINLTKNHFNKNGSFVVFTIAFLQNRLGKDKVDDGLRINAIEWIDLFAQLYLDNNIIQAYEQLSLNPLISYDNIKKHFKVFEKFIHNLLGYMSEQNWNINISKEEFIDILKSAYGYLMYNQVECKLNNKLSEIVEDVHYDKKYVIVLNNTKLFAEIKSYILKHCETKINDLIVLLLGGSNHLALDK